jgi:hypothetical protein
MCTQIIATDLEHIIRELLHNFSLYMETCGTVEEGARLMMLHCSESIIIYEYLLLQALAISLNGTEFPEGSRSS